MSYVDQATPEELEVARLIALAKEKSNKDLFVDTCQFCGRQVAIDVWKTRRGKCPCGAKAFCRRAKRNPDYCEEGWRKNGVEWITI